MLARSALALGLAAVAAALLSGPAAGRLSTSHTTSHPSRLKAFGDCKALVRYARDHLPKERRGPGLSQDGGPEPMQPAASDGGGNSSTTNVQEAGVDEPDLVKSQGATIYALSDGRLESVDTAGDKPRLLDSLRIPAGADELLVSGDRALAIRAGGGGWGFALSASAAASPALSDVIGYPSETVLTEVDIGDPSALRVVRSERIDGSYVSGRLTGTTARVVLSSVPQALWRKSLRGRASGWRPAAVVRNARTGRRHKRSLGSCHSIRRSSVFSGLDTLTVLTIDLDRGLPEVEADSVLTDGELVYASPDNLYVATERWQAPAVSTAIHKFDVSKPGETSYRASGEVTGALLNQFSMSDHDGALRVASTDSPWWWDGSGGKKSQSWVTSLVERAGRLVPVGRVGGLGHGQQIYAVRFAGDTGYVVTFRQVDPLYTLDLSDPTNPRVAGELELRGYSAYLHPIGPHLLLGVGQDTSEHGAPLGTQVSLFDVSDAARPVRLDHRVIANSDSEVEYDHHAFFWWGPEKLAMMPIWDYNGDGEFEVGYRVDPATGIYEVGRTSHGGIAEISRALVVDGRLYTVSADGVARNDFGSLAQLGFAAFPPSR